MNLNSLIVAFIDSQQAEKIVAELTESGIANESIILLGPEQAQQAILQPDSVIERAIRYFQDKIGGGAAELIRDVKNMKADQFLLVVQSGNLTTSKISSAENTFKKYNLYGAKHFGRFAVEHLTIAPNHRREMPLIQDNL